MLKQETQTRLRLYLFFWTNFLAITSNSAFFSLYFKHILIYPDGQTAVGLVGLFFFLQPLLCILANPLAGYIADRFKIENRILLICCVVTVAGGFILGYPVLCRQFPGAIPPDLAATTFFIGLGTLLTGIFSGPLIPIVNTEVYEYLHTFPGSGRSYGSFRVHGTLCWIVMTVLTGIALQLTRDFSIIFLLYCGGYMLCGLLALSGLRAVIKPVKIPWKYLKKDKYFFLFLIFCFFQAFGLYSVNNYLGYFFDELHLDYGLMGLAFAISAVPEVPLMFLAGRLCSRLGNRTMVLIGTIILMLRLVLLAVIASAGRPWLFLLVMPLGGAGVGFQVNGIMNLIDKWAHPDLRATYMNIYTMFGFNIPVALGCLFNALVIKVFNSTFMMVINALIVLAGIIFFICFVKDKKTADFDKAFEA